MSQEAQSPTPRRIQLARQAGLIPLSRTLSQALSLVVALVLIPSMLRATSDLVTRLWPLTAFGPHSAQAALSQSTSLVWLTLALVLPLTASLALCALVSGVLQTGGLWTWSRLSASEHLSPTRWAMRLGSASHWLSLGRALLWSASVLALFFWLLRSHLADLARSCGRLPLVLKLLQTLALRLGWQLALVLLLMGLLDLALSRLVWLWQLRMDRRARLEEQKQAQGDPQLRAARSREHHRLAQLASLQCLDQASVLITDGAAQAVALRYEPLRDKAPLVLLHGQAERALAITARAQALSIPIAVEPSLTRLLLAISEGEPIGPALYQPVAAVLSAMQSDAQSL